MLSQHNFVTLELNPETGRMEPVMPAQLWEETCGFTLPPDSLPEGQKEIWHHRRKRLVANGMALDMAWATATREAGERLAKFRDKSRKRFFRC